MSEEITALRKEVRQIRRVILFMATIWLIVVLIWSYLYLQMYSDYQNFARAQVQPNYIPRSEEKKKNWW